MKEDVRARTVRLRLDVALAVIVTACGLLPAPAASGQSPTPQERTAAIKESLARNQAALRQYWWIETTQVSLKGEVKKTEQKQCYYGADGKVQKNSDSRRGAACAAEAVRRTTGWTPEREDRGKQG